MKKVAIWIGVCVGLLLCWCLAVELRRENEVRSVTNAELTQFRDFLIRARRELAIHSMSDTGKLLDMSREFSALASKAKGSQSAGLRAYAEFFKEFAYQNQTRAEAATIMTNKIFHNFSTVRSAADLRSRRDAVQQLETAASKVIEQMSGLEAFVRTELEEQKLSTEEIESEVTQLMAELYDDTQFVIALCKIHVRYAQNTGDILDLLESELGYWGARNDGTVIFRRQPALNAFRAYGENHSQLRTEDIALRQRNLN